MDVHELRDAGASCGGKAQLLARLIDAGLPVPAGFVLDTAVFSRVAGPIDDGPDGVGHALEAAAARIATAELPAELVRDVAARMTELGARVVVRSSATIEDGNAGAGAGVFSSRAVPAAEVWLAIRAVWTSALTPLAAAYARRRGQTIAIGVIVQREVPGELVTVYTRPPGEPARDDLLVQRGEQLKRFSRASLPAAVVDQHAVLQALRAERAIGADAGGADVELVQAASDHDDVHVIETWVVQARPIVHPRPSTLAEPPPIVLAPLRDGHTWTWDVTHNPDPLSPAQVGLVERVDRAAIAPYALRVCAGYLYSSPRDVAVPDVTTAADLAARATELEARARATLDGATRGLDDTLARYLAFYAIWAGELSPLIASARRRSATKHHRPSSVEATLAAAARGDLEIADAERRLGDLAPVWDVASAPFGDRPGVLREAIAMASADARSRATEPTDDLASLAADLAERDDLLFAGAQRMVRRALLARAEELGIADDDVFWLPLDEVVAGVANDGTPIDAELARGRAAGARSAATRAAGWKMPLTVGPNVSEPEITAHGAVLRGVGSGPRVVGRVVRFASLAGAVFARPGDVVVVRAVTPALAVFVGRCAALVSETGGLLDHGAALARELGITCVVGCDGAWTTLHDGLLVAVDGDAGEITTIEPA